jgi:hypothetical protein
LAQPVHANRTLTLNSPITFENATGGSGTDTLNGGPGGDSDWFFRALDDVINDLFTGEFIEVM